MIYFVHFCTVCLMSLFQYLTRHSHFMAPLARCENALLGRGGGRKWFRCGRDVPSEGLRPTQILRIFRNYFGCGCSCIGIPRVSALLRRERRRREKSREPALMFTFLTLKDYRLWLCFSLRIDFPKHNWATEFLCGVKSTPGGWEIGSGGTM